MKEELTGQLAEGLYGSTEIFAKAAGFTGPNAEGELFKQMEKGLIKPTKEFMMEVARLYSESARTGGALDEAMKTTNAQFSRFNTELTLAKKQFFEGGFGSALADTFGYLADVLKNTDWSGIGAVFGGAVKGMADGLLAVTLPIRLAIAGLNALFGDNNGSKFLGYALGIAAVSAKIVLMGKAIMFLRGAILALTRTPLGFAIAIGAGALALGASSIIDKKIMSKGAETVPVNNAYRNQQGQVNVVIQPDGYEFDRAITARVDNKLSGVKQEMALGSV
jgi:hypothetical protein